MPQRASAPVSSSARSRLAGGPSLSPGSHHLGQPPASQRHHDRRDQPQQQRDSGDSEAEYFDGQEKRDGRLQPAHPGPPSPLHQRLASQHDHSRHPGHDKQCHSHAIKLATTSDDERDSLTRLFDYYLYSISLAVKAAPALSDHDQAVDWLETEHPNLLAAAAYAAGHGWPAHSRPFSVLLRHVWTRSEPNVFLRRRERGACLADL
jgi:hypothetical protein